MCAGQNGFGPLTRATQNSSSPTGGTLKCATDAASILGEAVHPVRKPPALQFAVHQRAWRTDK